MRKPSIVEVVGQASPRRESLQAAIRERVRQMIEAILHEEVEEAPGAGHSQRVPGRGSYRHGRKPRRLTLRGDRETRRAPGNASSQASDHRISLASAGSRRESQVYRSRGSGQ